MWMWAGLRYAPADRSAGAYLTIGTAVVLPFPARRAGPGGFPARAAGIADRLGWEADPSLGSATLGRIDTHTAVPALNARLAGRGIAVGKAPVDAGAVAFHRGHAEAAGATGASQAAGGRIAHHWWSAAPGVKVADGARFAASDAIRSKAGLGSLRAADPVPDAERPLGTTGEADRPERPLIDADGIDVARTLPAGLLAGDFGLAVETGAPDLALRVRGRLDRAPSEGCADEGGQASAHGR